MGAGRQASVFWTPTQASCNYTGVFNFQELLEDRDLLSSLLHLWLSGQYLPLVVAEALLAPGLARWLVTCLRDMIQPSPAVPGPEPCPWRCHQEAGCVSSTLECLRLACNQQNMQNWYAPGLILKDNAAFSLFSRAPELGVLSIHVRKPSTLRLLHCEGSPQNIEKPCVDSPIDSPSGGSTPKPCQPPDMWRSPAVRCCVIPSHEVLQAETPEHHRIPASGKMIVNCLLWGKFVTQQ
jgi:hypothetical protein